MTFTTDEDALRLMLNDAATGQPEMPVDRFTSVRRRHVRRRTAQASVAVAAAIAVVAGVVAVGSPLHTRAAQPTANQKVPSWALPWSDHRAGVPQKILDGAVNAWRHMSDPALYGGSLPFVQHVVWYAGNYAARGEVVAAIFEVDTGTQHRLVGAWATTDAVAHGQPSQQSSSPWVIYDVAAPNPTHFRGIVGLNVHGTTPPADAGNPDNWIVLLGPPSGTEAYVGIGRTVRLDHGFTIFDSGQLTTVSGPIEASVRDAHGRYPAGGNVGLPGSHDSEVPQLPQVTLDGVSLAAKDLGMMSGQGSAVNQDESSTYAGPTTIYARCRGGAAQSLRVSIDTDRPNRGVV
ncbi:MAG: hypothetical protein JO222_06240, partial [Frankiales bacterium]|nr:hypothetical protein [Frankiales bacterium]